MGAKTFFRELRRRNVLKVALAYAVIAWLVVEATSLLLFGHEERGSAMRALMVILAVGFAVILYISWAFEATPEVGGSLLLSLLPQHYWRRVFLHSIFCGAEVNRLRLPGLTCPEPHSHRFTGLRAG